MNEVYQNSRMYDDLPVVFYWCEYGTLRFCFFGAVRLLMIIRPAGTIISLDAPSFELNYIFVILIGMSPAISLTENTPAKTS